MARKRELTEDGSHVATAKGYAAGRLIEEGCDVPPGVPVGSWMAAKPESPAKAPEPSVAELKADIAKFDHDSDGRVGGSKPRKRSARSPEA